MVLLAAWNWDWFIPIVQSRASAAIGRRVTLTHLHVHLGRVIVVTADDVVVANPPDWPNPGDPPFASVKQLTIQADAVRYIKDRKLVLPLIGLDGLRVLAAETKDGASNFQLSTGGGGSGGGSVENRRVTHQRWQCPCHCPQAEGRFPRPPSGPRVKVTTRRFVVQAKGTYSAQPITARLVGGSLLSLRDADHPWPVDLELANGPTHVALNGTLKDPLAFQRSRRKTAVQWSRTWDCWSHWSAFRSRKPRPTGLLASWISMA